MNNTMLAVPQQMQRLSGSHEDRPIHAAEWQPSVAVPLTLRLDVGAEEQGVHPAGRPEEGWLHPGLHPAH